MNSSRCFGWFFFAFRVLFGLLRRIPTLSPASLRRVQAGHRNWSGISYRREKRHHRIRCSMQRTTITFSNTMIPYLSSLWDDRSDRERSPTANFGAESDCDSLDLDSQVSTESKITSCTFLALILSSYFGNCFCLNPFNFEIIMNFRLGTLNNLKYSHILSV